MDKETRRWIRLAGKPEYNSHKGIYCLTCGHKVAWRSNYCKLCLKLIKEGKLEQRE